MWTPFRKDVDRQIADMAFVIADVDIVFCEVICLVRGLADVQWDREMSCETSWSTWIFNSKDFGFCALLCLTSYVT